MRLSDVSIIAWIDDNQIRNEKGDLITFDNHLFLYDIYVDSSKDLTVMKGAQVGMTTCEIIKNHFDAKRYEMDIIYTLPTDKDVQVFVGGKVNRIIANNPCMLKDVADKDSVEQKQVGKSMIYFRGTWTKKAAMSVTADRLSHDEKDASKLDVVSDYQARIQASRFAQTHTFSHPSLPEVGVHADWLLSDQKHWFVKCEHCNHWQYLSWSLEKPSKMSIDLERKAFICKKCRKVLSDETRRCGQWVAKCPGKKMSGYWVPLLIAPWVSAEWFINKFNHPDTTREFFTTKILGLPYADGTMKLLRQHLMQNLTGLLWAPGTDERLVMGVDTGLKLDYVMGNKSGLFFQGDAERYEELDAHMRRWPRMICIIDAGGDIIACREFQKRWPGRVYLLSFGGEMKGMQLVKWGDKDEYGAVSCDRNRMIQLTVDEFREKRIPLHGTEVDWVDYYLDWSHLSKIKVLDPETNQVKGFKWVRSARDHRALATVAWRVGMTRFSDVGRIIVPDKEAKATSYLVNPNKTVSFNPDEMFGFEDEQKDSDWRTD